MRSGSDQWLSSNIQDHQTALGINGVEVIADQRILCYSLNVYTRYYLAVPNHLREGGYAAKTPGLNWLRFA